MKANNVSSISIVKFIVNNLYVVHQICRAGIGIVLGSLRNNVQVVNLTENSLSHWLLFLVPFLSALKLSLKGDLCVFPCLAHSLFCSALCFSSS